MTFTWITTKLILGRYSSWSLTSASRMQVSNRQWSSCSVVDFQMALYLSTKYTQATVNLIKGRSRVYLSRCHKQFQQHNYPMVKNPFDWMLQVTRLLLTNQRALLKMSQSRSLLVTFRLFHVIQFKCKLKKAQTVCLGLEPGARRRIH